MGDQFAKGKGGGEQLKGSRQTSKDCSALPEGFQGEQNEVHDPTILRLMQANCQGLKRLAVQSIWCRGELGYHCDCASNVRLTKQACKQNLTQNAATSKTLFHLKSCTFGSTANWTCCQIEQISDLTLVKRRLGFI